jgi:deazaflavin-dependent oxidoreductase (nitroreductase family)
MQNTAAIEKRPEGVSQVVDRIIRPLTRVFNPLIMRVAGSPFFPMFSLLHHRGHKSGRAYTTPVSALPHGGFFWLGLAFGTGSGWARNVLAAGECDLRYRGVDYHLVEPEVLEIADVRSQLSWIERAFPRLVRAHQTLRMRDSSAT